jgi:hypothetical protein
MGVKPTYHAKLADCFRSRPWRPRLPCGSAVYQGRGQQWHNRHKCRALSAIQLSTIMLAQNEDKLDRQEDHSSVSVGVHLWVLPIFNS